MRDFDRRLTRSSLHAYSNLQREWMLQRLRPYLAHYGYPTELPMNSTHDYVLGIRYRAGRAVLCVCLCLCLCVYVCLCLCLCLCVLCIVFVFVCVSE